jgi:CDP-diacylglycerol--serine O-phosphatidyltransferase
VNEASASSGPTPLPPTGGAGSPLRLHEADEPAKANPEAPPGYAVPLPQTGGKFKKKRRPPQHASREHRRRRLRRYGRRAYVRSIYFLPSLMTLGNAICGFGAIYVSSLDSGDAAKTHDPWTYFFAMNSAVTAAYLIFVAMLFDALDGRLARWTRHTTDFGGQLDSLADVISFGVAPAFLALELFKTEHGNAVVPFLSRLVWAIGALYMSCAAMRLARFNVSNEHGEQAHFSFLGLPSPGAGGAVAGFILLQQELRNDPWHGHWPHFASYAASTFSWLLPLLVLVTGLLMISNIRYGHMVNRYLRGRKSIGRLILVVALSLLFVIAHRYVVAIGAVGYALAGPVGLLMARIRRRGRITA